VLHVVPEDLAKELTGYVSGGGHLVTTYFAGIVDGNDHVWLGGYPGALRDLLGIRIEELAPLLDGERVELDNGTTGMLWTDRIDLVATGVEVLARYRSGEQAGRPAITRRPLGAGSAAYVSTRLGAAGLPAVLGPLLAAAGVDSDLPPDARGRVELAVRSGPGGEFWFLVNRTAAEVPVAGVDGAVLLGRRAPGGALLLDPRGVAVVQRAG
jgi:beta-galactosidase